MTLGVIADDPATVAQRAGVSLDMMCLARMIHSEFGDHVQAERIACAECARNYAAERGISISSLLLRSPRAEANGKFSKHRITLDDGSVVGAKWASTFLDARGSDLAIAKMVIEGGSNITSGSVDFYAPGEVSRAAAVAYFKDNAKMGLQWVGPIDGVDPRKVMCFVRVDGADVTGAISALDGNGTIDDTVQGDSASTGSKNPFIALLDFILSLFGLGGGDSAPANDTALAEADTDSTGDDSNGA